ncbi:MAG: hypothetical protein MZU79_04065 [Anaerotruncus sp.]|nr:hypothetical protein [Anaerotruncus sp.]
MDTQLDLRLEKSFTMAKQVQARPDPGRLQRLQRRHHHFLGHAHGRLRLVPRRRATRRRTDTSSTA